MSAAKTGAIFFCTAESLREVLREMQVVDQNETRDEAEQWLRDCEKTDEDDNPKYWRRVKIFKVTVEEVPRTKP